MISWLSLKLVWNTSQSYTTLQLLIVTTIFLASSAQIVHKRIFYGLKNKRVHLSNNIYHRITLEDGYVISATSCVDCVLG